MSESDERGPSDRPALTRLTGIPASQFARDHWGERPLLTRAAAGFADLFSERAVDELVADRALRTPFVRMAAEGTVHAPSLFTSSGGFGAEIGDQLDSEKVLEQFAEGSTLVLQGLHRTWQPIAAFTRQLVADLGHPAQVNAYITPASSRGFDPHYDTHDVFVIQIAGAKHWRIHEPVHRHPLADQPWTDHRDAVAARAQLAPAIDAVFEPGDVLYLPRGWIHSAEALGGTSIHLTIGVRAATRHDVLARLLAHAGDDARLRAPLPLGVDYSDAAVACPRSQRNHRRCAGSSGRGGRRQRGRLGPGTRVRGGGAPGPGAAPRDDRSDRRPRAVGRRRMARLAARAHRGRRPLRAHRAAPQDDHPARGSLERRARAAGA